MIRPALLVVCSVLLIGTSCPGAGSTLTCANQLDGSEFGFTLTVPEGFTCVPTSPLQLLLVLARATFSQESTGIGVSIAVSQPQDDASDGDLAGITVEDLPNQTNSAGIEFQVQKLSVDLGAFGMQTSRSGGTTLPSGNNLIITVTAETDRPELASIFSMIIETVALAGS